MTADLASPLDLGVHERQAPLPAIGVVGRAYVLPEVAINFEMSTFRVPEGSIPDVEANYYDWDIHGTVNVSNNVGLQIGWRRMTNFLAVESDIGDIKFQGLWFGAALDTEWLSMAEPGLADRGFSGSNAVDVGE